MFSKCFVLLAVLLALGQLIQGCLITNCPRGGKRSGKFLPETNVKPVSHIFIHNLNFILFMYNCIIYFYSVFHVVRLIADNVSVLTSAAVRLVAYSAHRKQRVVNATGCSWSVNRVLQAAPPVVATLDAALPMVFAARKVN